jgi:hypothetical protein
MKGVELVQVDFEALSVTQRWGVVLALHVTFMNQDSDG